MYIYIEICIHTHARYTHRYTYIYVHMQMYIHIYVVVYVLVYVFVYVHVYVYGYFDLAGMLQYVWINLLLHEGPSSKMYRY